MLEGRTEEAGQAGPLDLPEGHVHLWISDHRVRGDELDTRLTLLDEDERQRAARFRFHKDFRRFVAGHGRVRSILGRYAGIRADELRITRRCGFCGSEDHGKPSLLSSSGAPSKIRFSCSYSDQLVVVAVSNGAEIGVDVERVVAGFAWRQVAETALSSRERSLLDAAGEDSAVRAFFGIWTRKEAVSKVSGRGLDQLTQMDTCGWTYGPEGEFEVVEGSSETSCVGRVLELPGHQAAVAIEGTSVTSCAVMEGPGNLQPVDEGA